MSIDLHWQVTRDSMRVRDGKYLTWPLGEGFENGPWSGFLTFYCDAMGRYLMG